MRSSEKPKSHEKIFLTIDFQLSMLKVCQVTIYHFYHFFRFIAEASQVSISQFQVTIRAQSCLEMLTTTSIFVWASLLNFSLGIPDPSPFGPFLDNGLNNMMNNMNPASMNSAASMNPTMNKIMNNRGADYGKHCSLSFIFYFLSF